MKKNIIIIIVSLISLVLIFFCVRFLSKNIISSLTPNKDDDTVSNVIVDNKLIDKKIPFFDLSDIGGNRIKSSHFIDKPLVVIFWATWNVESVNQIKIIDEYISSNDISKLASVVTIDSQEDISVIKSFVRRSGYNIDILIDESGLITNNFNVKSLPTTFFVDKDGIIKEIYVGVLNEELLVDKVEQLLK